MRGQALPVIAMIAMAFTPVRTLAQESCKNIGTDWVWVSDHVALSVEYYVAGPKGRRYEVGTGMSVNDSVWGATESGDGLTEVTAWGMGALHVRRIDQGEDFRVCVGATKLQVIELCGKAYQGLSDCPTF